jgi:hypothetical protein
MNKNIPPNSRVQFAQKIIIGATWLQRWLIQHSLYWKFAWLIPRVEVTIIQTGDYPKMRGIPKIQKAEIYMQDEAIDDRLPMSIHFFEPEKCIFLAEIKMPAKIKLFPGKLYWWVIEYSIDAKGCPQCIDDPDASKHL